MAQTQHALFSHGNQEQIDYTPGGALDAGDIVGLGTGTQRLVGVALAALEASKLQSLCISGIFKVKKASDQTFSVNDKIGWNEGDEQAEPAGDEDEDFGLGVCVKAAANGDDYVLTKINAAQGYQPAVEGSA